MLRVGLDATILRAMQKHKDSPEIQVKGSYVYKTMLAYVLKTKQTHADATAAQVWAGEPFLYCWRACLHILQMRLCRGSFEAA
jgi:hypothetical protein